MIVLIQHAHHDVERRDVDVDSKPGRLESIVSRQFIVL